MANPNAGANAQHRKLAAIRHRATPPWADRTALRALYVEAAYRTAKTGDVYVVEPIIPLKHAKVCGLHVPGNLHIVIEDQITDRNDFFSPQLEMAI